MQIKELFAKPIEREINPAVIVSQQDDEIIRTEIEEYVFTQELAEKIFKFLNTFITRKEGNTGIWINGYYGSGKSHFIKYLHYCIHPDICDTAFDHYKDAVNKLSTDLGDITPSNITVLRDKMKKLNLEDIMFNVEAETGDDSVKERLTRVLLRQLNKHRGYNGFNIPLAIYFEKHLDKLGKLDDFKKLLNERHRFTWEKDSDDLLSTRLSLILDLASELDPELDKGALHKTLTDAEHITINISDILVNEFNEYLEEKPKDFRLLFLVDEVSQYIGANREILLNLQTIVEEIGKKCSNQIWIACTAQQSLDTLVQDLATADVKDEFGKILGRFDPEHNRISLESTDAAYITQKRVLDKNSDGEKILTKLFREQQDAIEMQFKLHHDLYKGYEGEEDFILAYPFIPYQFRLISNVFESFQNLGYVIREVKDNERSILGITHYTARQNADLEVESFIPFDAFFNNQFTANMQHRGRKAIEPALSLSFVKNDAFTGRVVRVLFMISNLSDTVRQTFPPNIDNLILLLMTRLDENKMDLQRNIHQVLEKLMEENIIREENGNYYFFNEDEMDVTHEIRNTVPTMDERLREFNDLISPLIGVNRKIEFGARDFNISYRIDDKQWLKGEHAEFAIILYENKDADMLSLGNPKETLLLCVNEWFLKDADFKKDFEWYCKTSEYLLHHTGAATGQRTETLSNFRTRNGRLKEQLNQKLFGKITSFKFVSGSTVLEPSKITGTKPKERYLAALNKHIMGIYRHLPLAREYSHTAADLRKKAASPAYQTVIDNSLTEAETLVNDEISNRGEEVTLHDLVQHFGKAPFGWKDVALIDMVLELYRKKYRALEYRHQPRYPVKDFIEKALNASERQVCVVKSGEEIPPEELEAALRNFKGIFNLDLKNKKDPESVFDEMIKCLETIVSESKSMVSQYHGRYPFGETLLIYSESIGKLAGIHEPRRLFNQLDEENNDLKSQTDRFKSLDIFISERIGKYDEIRNFVQDNRENLKSIEGEIAEKLIWLDEYFKKEDPEGDLRIAIKSCDELKTALKTRLENECKKALDIYNLIFDELDKKAQDLKVDQYSYVYTDRQTIMDSISKEKSLTGLSLRISQADDFKTGELKKILQRRCKEDEKDGKQAAEPVEIYARDSCSSELRTEEDVENFIEHLRTELMDKINKKKVIIIK